MLAKEAGKQIEKATEKSLVKAQKTQERQIVANAEAQ